METGFRNYGVLTIVQLGLGVFENVTCDARLICSLGDSILQHVEQVGEIFVPATAVIFRLVVHVGKNAQQRNVVLPVVRSTTEVGYPALHIDNLVQQPIIHITLDPEAVVERETGVKCISLEVGRGVHVPLAVLTVVV